MRRNPDTYIVRIIVSLVIIFTLAQCNPVKRVLNDSKKTQAVVDNYVKNFPVKKDTITKFTPGNLTTAIEYKFDTLYINHGDYNYGNYNIGDSVRWEAGGGVKWRAVDTVTITKTITKTRDRTDTIQITVPDANQGQALSACQKILQDKDITIADANKYKPLSDLWKLRFWVLVGAIGVIVGVVGVVKLAK